MEEKKVQENKKNDQKATPKKKRLRTKLVLIFLVLTAIIGYICFRGSYL